MHYKICTQKKTGILYAQINNLNLFKNYLRKQAFRQKYNLFNHMIFSILIVSL